MPKVTKFTVIRETWLRGWEDGESELLSAKGYRCCLGFLGQACQISDDDLYEVAEPQETRDALGWWPKSIVKDVGGPIATPLCYEIIGVNDKAGVPDAKRERQLKRLFRKAGISVHFKGRRRQWGEA